MKLNQKDKSFLLFIAAVLVVLWASFSFFSNIFLSATFRFSDVRKIISVKNQEWLNVSRPLEFSDLKNRVILLHFWNYACINCIEDLAKIKKMESYYGSKLLVIGVHQSKFENEKDY